MSVKVDLHSFFYDGIDLANPLEVKGQNVGECLADLVRRYPPLEDKLFAKTGKLHGYVEVFVNAESSYPEELAYPVQDGDVLTVSMFLAGG